AQQTARALTPEFRVVEEIGTGAAAEDLLRACGWPKAGHALVVVGHQPTLGEVAAWLLTGTRGQWNLKKGAVIWIAGGGFARPSLRAAIAPDLL
ncbi:MAG: histidine phosphatase family protein, partial [Pseudomonadota bacterium]